MPASYPSRVGIVQRVLPRYRAAFFDLLASHCEEGLSVFAGHPRSSEAIPSAEKLRVANWAPTKNIHIFGGPFYFCYQRGLFDWLEGWDPQVLVVEANPRYLSTPAAIRRMHRRGRTVIGWGLGAPSERGGLAGVLRKSFLRQLDGVIAYSQRGADEYRSMAIAEDHIYVAPNAVSPRPKNAPPKKPPQFSGGRGTVLYVGRLQARKRLDVLVRACVDLPANFQPNLEIVGDGPERAPLEKLAARIYPRAKFLGTLFGVELDAQFEKADLFVLPGTGGLAIQQAMSHGLSLIVAEGDGSQANMVRPANGWLVPPGNENALLETLKQALGDPARLRKMGLESFRLASTEFNLENMAEAFISALNRVAA